MTSAGFGAYFYNFIARGRQIKRNRDLCGYPETDTECLNVLGRVQLLKNCHLMVLPPKILFQGPHLRITAWFSTFLDFTKLPETLKVINHVNKEKVGLLFNKRRRGEWLAEKNFFPL